jgi:FkbM family methyltransferase
MNLPSAAQLFEHLPRSLRRHRLMRWWMTLTGENPVQLVRIRDDAFGYADMSDGFLRLIVIDGSFEHDFFRVADALLESGGVFLDGGANYGLLSFGLAAKHCDTVDFHLFEPNPKLVAAINRSTALYPRMRCKVNEVALAAREGVVRFLFDDHQSGVSHISPDAANEVKATTIDHYLEQQGITRVDLLKLDVEGYELVALQGAGRSLATMAIRAVYFEYFEKLLSRVRPPHHLLDFLTSLDYEVCFCRTHEITGRGGATHTIREDLPGHGLMLLPIRGHTPAEMTDLLAVPRQHLVRLTP